MSIKKTTQSAIIDEATLANATATVLADCTNVPLSTGMQLAFTVEATFDASATAGLDITLRPSYNSSDYDTSAWCDWTWSIAVDAGATIRQTSYAISPVAQGMKIIVENMDATYSVTNLKIYPIKQTAG